jgi:hypothetical protein
MPWTLVGHDSEILAVHAAFVGFNRILFYGGDQHDPVLAAAQKFDHATRLFDCTTFAVTEILSPPFDAFCSGHAMTVGGTVLVAGGTGKFNEEVIGLHHVHFAGLRDTAVFRLEKAGPVWRTTADLNPGERARLCEPGENPETDECVTEADHGKTGGRWYPTLVTLPNGDVLALGGHPGAGDRQHFNYIPEVFTPQPLPGGGWHRLGSYTNPAENQLYGDHNAGYYPRAHLLPTGDILLSSPTVQNKTVTLSVNRSPWSATFHAVCDFAPRTTLFPKFDEYVDYHTTSVLLPLGPRVGRRSPENPPTPGNTGYDARVLLCGGEQPWILNLTKWKPSTTKENEIRWQPTAARALTGKPRRFNGDAVLLPTGEVVALGGIPGAQAPDGGLDQPDKGAVLTPELFNPYTNKWSTSPGANEDARVTRNYHSVSILMPDGRVFTAGSDHDAGRGAAPDGKAELQIEIYEPWYYRRANRPEVVAAPDRWTTGEQISIRTTQAGDIIRVVLMRCGTSTHAFNPDQRCISLWFIPDGGDRLLVTTPADGNIMPSGMYYLFTINSKRLPSSATTIYASTDPESDTERAWNDLLHG